MLEANIAEEMILSYEWMSLFRIDISPWRHGLIAQLNGGRAWIPGAKTELGRVSDLRFLDPHVNALTSNVQNDQPKRALD